jgi:hypothetical protein
MDAVTRTYIKMRAAPPAPKLGARVGFLTEGSSMAFLAEYNRMREANLIVPSAINTAAASGAMMLTEAVDHEDQADQATQDAMVMAAAMFLEENRDNVSDANFRLIAAMPAVFAGVARELDVPLDELTIMLLDPEEDQREIADAILEDIIENLEEQLDEDEDDVQEMALPDSQSKTLKRTVIDILRSGYTPGSRADRAFAALHRVERWDDASGNGDEVFDGSNVRQVSRSPRYGYKTGEDTKKYDNLKEHVTPLLDRSIVRPVIMGESSAPWAPKTLSGLRRA